MTLTHAIGAACNKVILLIVRGLALSRIHPNVLTFIGLLVNGAAAALLASHRFLGLLVYYASINRFFYVVLTAVVMTGSVMVSYTRARAECTIPRCKVGFMERPERVVLIIIGALFDRMAPVLWIIAVMSNVTVIHRVLYTWWETKRLGDGQTQPPVPELTTRSRAS